MPVVVLHGRQCMHTIAYRCAACIRSQERLTKLRAELSMRHSARLYEKEQVGAAARPPACIVFAFMV